MELVESNLNIFKPTLISGTNFAYPTVSSDTVPVTQNITFYNKDLFEPHTIILIRNLATFNSILQDFFQDRYGFSNYTYQNLGHVVSPIATMVSGATLSCYRNDLNFGDNILVYAILEK